jgi:Ca2+-binding RTX toxin-like protein
MTVTTPVATIGIRGTKVAGEIKPAGEESKFTVIEGAIAVSTQAGSVFMSGNNETTSVSSLTAPPSTPVILSQGQIEQSYSSVSSVAPKMLTNTPQQEKDAEAGATQDHSGKGAEGEGEAGVSDTDKNAEDVSENGLNNTSAASKEPIQFVSSDINFELIKNIKISEPVLFENFKPFEFISGRPPSTDFGGRASLPDLIVEQNDAPEGAPTGNIVQVANSQTIGSEVFLQGTFIELGVSAAGTLGTLARAPVGFHPSSSDGRMSTVIDVDSFGAGQDSGLTRSGDFTLPGAPIESYTIGYRETAPGNPVLIHQNGAAGLNTLNSFTVDNSFGNVLSTVTSGAAGNISMIRDISFNADQLAYAVTVIVTNISRSEIFDVRYLHNMDIDVDSNFFNNVQTKNDVLLNTGFNSSDKIAIAQAVGPESGLQINLLGIGTEYRVSNFGLNNISPYDSSAFNIPVDRNGISVDESISIAISFGNMFPGETQAKQYFVSFNSANIGSDVLVGTEGGDVLKGFAGNDVFVALSGDDILDGGGGNDTFFSGSGNDVISGGNGEDTLSFEVSKNAIIVNLQAGTSLNEGNDTFSSIENIIGSDFSDIFIGSSGNNTLDGGYGADTMSGGDGDDFFKYNYKDLDFIVDQRTVIGTDEFDFISGFKIGKDKFIFDNTFGFNEVGSPKGELLGIGRAFRFFQNADTVLVEGKNFFIIDTPFNGTPSSSPVFSGENDLNPESVIFSTSDRTLYFDRNGSESGYTVVAQFDDGLSAALSPSDIIISSG